MSLNGKRFNLSLVIFTLVKRRIKFLMEARVGKRMNVRVLNTRRGGGKGGRKCVARSFQRQTLVT